MKLFSLLFIFLFGTGFSNISSIENDREKLNIKGNVNSVKETKYNAESVDGKFTKIGWTNKTSREKDTYTIYNNKGCKIEETKYNADGSVFVNSKFKYDENNNLILIEKSEVGPQPKRRDEILYTYDKNGNLVLKDIIIKTFQKKKFKLLYSEYYIYKYDTKNRIIEEQYFKEPDGIRPSDNTIIYNYELSENTIEAANSHEGGIDVTTTIFNDLGWKKEVMRVYYNPRNYLDEKEIYTYDKHGNVSSYEMHVFKNPYALTEKVLEWDTRQRKYFITSVKLVNFEKEYVPTMYNSYEYKYDKLNNWTEKIEFDSTAVNDNKTPISITKREIIYFE